MNVSNRLADVEGVKFCLRSRSTAVRWVIAGCEYHRFRKCSVVEGNAHFDLHPKQGSQAIEAEDREGA